MRLFKWIVPVLLALGLASCATSQNRQATALENAQYAWTAAIRWGDIVGAWKQVDPDYRARHALTDAEVNRYKLVEVTGYTPVDSNMLSPDLFERTIEITVVNKKDMSARTVTFQERWRYDAASQTWWATQGLPDFWDGR